MVKTKELIICIISIVALVLAITTNVFAAAEDIETLVGIGNNNNSNNSDNEFSQTQSGVQSGNNNTTNTTNNTNNTNNTMPNTGIGENSSLIIIAIAGISAIYAYRKIKEYNI